MAGHENKFFSRILSDKNFHIIDIALGIMTVDAAP